MNSTYEHGNDSRDGDLELLRDAAEQPTAQRRANLESCAFTKHNKEINDIMHKMKTFENKLGIILGSDAGPSWRAKRYQMSTLSSPEQAADSEEPRSHGSGAKGSGSMRNDDIDSAETDAAQTGATASVEPRDIRHIKLMSKIERLEATIQQKLDNYDFMKHIESLHQTIDNNSIALETEIKDVQTNVDNLQTRIREMEEEIAGSIDYSQSVNIKMTEWLKATNEKMTAYLNTMETSHADLASNIETINEVQLDLSYLNGNKNK